MTTVLAIHAHPDDIEFQCAGTLLRLADAGLDICLATMTPGDCGSAEMAAEEISTVRRGEAARAAALLGASYKCLEFRDLSIVFDNPSRRRVTEFLRRVRPDIVLTAPPVDYMPDHELTSRLVRDACFNAPIPNFATEADQPAAALQRIPHLYYVDAIEGVDWYGQPLPAGRVVDVSRTFERKLEMLACHESQRAWLLKQHGMDEYLESCRRWGAARGEEIGADYGEAFRQHRGHPYPGDDLLVNLLETATPE
ncbi:MAG: LmbE family protein [Planctomycetaceae bacterium]|jgi:LmbE family N-acetylglucosaminyl deacetylase|nr:LmbE family protein [Planctomycetaceae bacterium]MDP7276583.1 PIG-L family deacetylase [Planctomycetaceae bacterium]